MKFLFYFANSTILTILYNIIDNFDNLKNDIKYYKAYWHINLEQTVLEIK